MKQIETGFSVVLLQDPDFTLGIKFFCFYIDDIMAIINI